MGINIKLVQDSFAEAAPIGDQVVNKFYEFLFSDYPAAKPLFQNTDMEKQKTLLLKSLVFSVENLGQVDKLEPYLKAMGARHVGYGTEDAHYELVGNTLIKTLKFFFAEKWTEELESQWVQVFGVVSEIMKEGAAEHLAKQGNDSKVDNIVPIHKGSLPQASDVELPGRLVAAIQDWASETVDQMILEQYKTALKEELEKRTPEDVQTILKKVS